MQNLTRRIAIQTATAGALVAGTSLLGGTTEGKEPEAAKLWPLEGELKVHPKFLYRYYLEYGHGQICALYGADHGRDSDLLARLQLPVRVRVSGVLGTAYHAGGTKENLSPFPATWLMYMDVQEVEVVK